MNVFVWLSYLMIIIIDESVRIEKKADISKRIIFSGDNKNQQISKKPRNKSCNSHNSQTIQSDLSLQYNHPMYVSNPYDENIQSSKKQKRRKNKTTKLINQIPDIEIDILQNEYEQRNDDLEVDAIIYTDNPEIKEPTDILYGILYSFNENKYALFITLICLTIQYKAFL